MQTEQSLVSEDNALNNGEGEDSSDQVLIIEGGAILIEGKKDDASEIDENANNERAPTPRFDHHQFKARLKDFALRSMQTK